MQAAKHSLHFVDKYWFGWGGSVLHARDLFINSGWIPVVSPLSLAAFDVMFQWQERRII
jgi:hypothetical protein